uniref:CSab-Lyc-7 n=1 Tax=Lychas buchari TaxID=1330406 RepID=T1DEM5_9SCOR
MKNILILEVILLSLLGVSLSFYNDGHYPRKLNKEKYHCMHRGSSYFCEQVCKLHNVPYGYCRDYKCFCEELEWEDIYYLAKIEKSCESELDMSYKFEFQYS